MRQLFLDNEKLTIKEVCEPQLEDTHILVSVHYSFLGSAAEVSTAERAKENLFFSTVPQKIKKVMHSFSHIGLEEMPIQENKIRGRIQPIGYSCSGQVIAVGKQVTNLREGDFVACAGAHFAKHADIISMPQHLVTKIHDTTMVKDASLATVGALALQGIRRANLQIGEYVCVVGLGVLGQLTLQMARISGCNVIGIDITSRRLSLATQHGAIASFHAVEDNVISEIEFLTNHHGVDCTIITASSKSDAIIHQAMEITRKKGKVVIISDVGLHLERNPFYQKEIELLISCSYGPGRNDYEYEQLGKDYPYELIRWTEHRNIQAFIQLIENKKIDTANLISEQISISEIESAYSKLKNKETMGILVDYTHEKETYLTNIRAKKEDTSTFDRSQPNTKKNSCQIQFTPAKKTTLSVGIIGAGGFSKLNLAPLVAKQERVHIDAIVDKNISDSLNMSKIYGATKCYTDYEQFFNESSSDVVVISSEHKYHCTQTLEALRHGKAVFLEKPMAIHFQELEHIKTFLEKNPATPLCVDYSRSFSPFVQKIKQTIAQRKSPLVINYRMNVELLRDNKLAIADMGAGRIIGEACSIFDIFYYVTDSTPISVSVESLNPSNSQLFPTDNFCAQLRFADGSLCSLTYTSLGHQDMGRERMEVFFDSKSIVMEDYKILQGFGLRKSFDECCQCPNKGRSTLVSNFFANLHKPTFVHPISVSRLCDVAYITLVVDQLACRGGGNKTV